MDVALKTINKILYIVVDLFCGAGGVTNGYEEAKISSNELADFLKSVGGISLPANYYDVENTKISQVVACINHDPVAIKSHHANNPNVLHFEEDITKLYGSIRYGILMQSPEFRRLIRLLDIYRAFYPDAKIIVWGSLECTNFSKAKGGLSRNADSRTLAQHLLPYIIALDPHYIKIENVVEFRDWGKMTIKVADDGLSCPLNYDWEKDERGKKKIGKHKRIISTGPTWIPDKRYLGEYFQAWRKSVCALGYRDEWKELNSANFGAYTSRNRLFGCFAKPGLPIVWPQSTHVKKPTLFKKHKWKAVKEVLDFDDEGESIFNRKKKIPKVRFTKEGYAYQKLNKYNWEEKTFGPLDDELSPKSKQRFYKGLIRHIAGGEKSFLTKYYSGNGDKSSSINSPGPAITTIPHEAIMKACFISRYNGVNGGKHDNSQSIEGPIGAIPTKDCQAKMEVHFIAKEAGKFLILNNSNKPAEKGGGNDGRSIEEPAPTLGTGWLPGIVQAQFLDQQFSQGTQNQSIEEPHWGLTSVPKSKLISADFFIDKQYSGDENHQSIEQPAGALLPNDKHNLIRAEHWIMSTHFNNVGHSTEQPAPVITGSRHHHYLINPSWGGNPGSVQEPCPVVIARQDKAPLYLITCQKGGQVAVPVYDTDNEWDIKIKEFMALYNIVDIKMRMLKVQELKLIQGFPADYVLLGTQTDQKKFIGNSVVPLVVEVWIKSFFYQETLDYLKQAA